MRALLRLWRRWKTQYKLAKKSARKNGDPNPLVELYKCSNEFPQAVARQRAKMRRMLGALGSWWEDPRIFGLVNLQTALHGVAVCVNSSILF